MIATATSSTHIGHRAFIRYAVLIVGIVLFFLTNDSNAAPGLPIIGLSNDKDGGQTYTLSIQLLFLMTMLTVLPSLIISMTAFTRIIIVMSILRQAMGTMSSPSNQILIGLSLFLTYFIMAPIFEQMNQEAFTPYINEEITPQVALEKARIPLQRFMLAQTREADLALFVNLSGQDGIESRDTVPFSVLLPAFITSEIKTAFTIGFLLFIPFLIIDLVVASVLMSMGMVMLSPMMISIPFKILLFVLVDGWTLLMGTLASSFIA